jgi:hypothetical protein
MVTSMWHQQQQHYTASRQSAKYICGVCTIKGYLRDENRKKIEAQWSIKSRVKLEVMWINNTDFVSTITNRSLAHTQYPSRFTLILYQMTCTIDLFFFKKPSLRDGWYRFYFLLRFFSFSSSSSYKEVKGEQRDKCLRVILRQIEICRSKWSIKSLYVWSWNEIYRDEKRAWNLCLHAHISVNSLNLIINQSDEIGMAFLSSFSFSSIVSLVSLVACSPACLYVI